MKKPSMYIPGPEKARSRTRAWAQCLWAQRYLHASKFALPLYVRERIEAAALVLDMAIKEWGEWEISRRKNP